MFNLETKIKIPFLWGKAVFRKNYWSQINLIVGPNGSGKTLLAEKLAQQFSEGGFNVKFIKADRKYNDQIFTIKNDEKIRSRIEKVLSSMFGKSIKFIEDIDQTMIPIVENKAWNVEYMLEDAECHGLKEIISLLISLYSAQPNDCVFIDEPELHLHPQFQSFFMNEIRKEVKNSSRRTFFLITHSPFFIDLRSSEDLTGVICCHINAVPSTIEELSEDDDGLFRRFLPRFNTYHKQFFFSDNQIFVEGYTDQQMFTYLLQYIEDEYNAAGTGIIDVGGKDELGVFCKVCSLLGTNGRIITDLDSLFSGKLRDVFCQDQRVLQWMEKQEEKQESFYKSIFSNRELESKVTLERLILRLERYLTQMGQDFYRQAKKNPLPGKLQPFMEKLQLLHKKYDNAEAIDTYKTVLLQGVNNEEESLIKFLSPHIAKTIPLIKNLAAFILAAAESARVYILHKGCIEHYYSQTNLKYMPVSGKDKLFRNELDFIQSAHKKTVRKAYSDLIVLLEKASSRN